MNGSRHKIGDSFFSLLLVLIFILVYKVENANVGCAE